MGYSTTWLVYKVETWKKMFMYLNVKKRLLKSEHVRDEA